MRGSSRTPPPTARSPAPRSRCGHPTQRVAVVGDFDDWGGRAHPMRMIGSSGVWEVFVPDVRGGARYKFRVHGADGVVRDKADPMARQTNPPPATSSIVNESEYVWATTTGWPDAPPRSRSSSR